MDKKRRSAIVESILQETHHLRGFFLVREPIEKLSWTKSLPDFGEAQASARDALHRLWAQTKAAQAGHNSESPDIDIFLYKIRSQITPITDTPELHAIIGRALKSDRAGIFQDIADAQAAARKRRRVVYDSKVISGTVYSDFNFFRGQLAY